MTTPQDSMEEAWERRVSHFIVRHGLTLDEASILSDIIRSYGDERERKAWEEMKQIVNDNVRSSCDCGREVCDLRGFNIGMETLRKAIQSKITSIREEV